jgi:putative ABC transport system permease protein
MILVAILVAVILAALLALLPLFFLLRGGEILLGRLDVGRASRFLLLLLKSLRRNPLRTALTYLAVLILVGVVTLVWSALYVLDHMMESKSKDIKVVISEKWQDNGAMPFSYARPLCEGGADPARPDAVRPTDGMTWQFYVGTIDPEKKTLESQVMFIAIEPRKAATVMDRTFDEVPQESGQQSGPKLARAQEFLAALDRMENNRRGVIIGRRLLARLNKRVGERMKVTGINYKEIDLEVEITGAFPDGHYNDTAIMNRDYLNDALDLYPRSHLGLKHPLANRSLNLVVVEVPDKDAYSRVTQQIDSSGQFTNPTVRCETLDAYAAGQLESYRDILWAMRWLLAPAILMTTCMIVANGISISVRERRKEIAVLKVLGYRPVQVLALILGEGVLIGAFAGCLSSMLVYQAVNRLMDNSGSILPVYVPAGALWWGPAVGALTGWAGSLAPAWAACRVQVATVFARVA